MSPFYQMLIHRADLDDVDAISDLENLLFENAFGPGTLRRELRHSVGELIYLEGELVAYALVRPDGDLHDLLRLGVHPNHRRKGYARQLLERVLLTCPGPFLLTVRKNNNGALALYKQTGFEIVAELENNWLMRRG